MAKKKKKNKVSVILVILLFGVALILLWNNLNGENPIVKLEPKKHLNIINLDSNERPIAIMINNHSIARQNHAGLNDAYIVYEAIVEGGLTRLMAIFKDKDTARIGSVRSSRHYFLDYALENDAIYVHYGWSPQAESDINILRVDNINGLTDDAFYRDKSLNVAYEHTAFTSMADIKKIAKTKNYRLTSSNYMLLNYSEKEVDLSSLENSIVANNVIIPYSSYVTTSYVYDSINKVYLRYVNNKEHKDSITNNIYTTKNIIIMKINNRKIDSYGRQTLDNIGSGEGYYITNGYSIPITWSKSSRTSKTIYTKTTGEEIDVNDGNTYIQIMPLDKTLQIN